MLLLGSYPVDIFAGAAKVLLYTAVPAAFVSSVPARLVEDFDAGWAGWLVAVAGIFAFAGWATFTLGLRRYTSGSVWTRRSIPNNCPPHAGGRGGEGRAGRPWFGDTWTKCVASKRCVLTVFGLPVEISLDVCEGVRPPVAHDAIGTRGAAPGHYGCSTNSGRASHHQ